MSLLGLFGAFIAACWARFLIWALAMVVTVIPVVSAAKAHFSTNIDKMAIAVNEAHFFHEFYFVIIIAAIFGISNTIYSAFFFERRVPIWVNSLFITAVVFFIYAIISGTFRFIQIAQLHDKVDVLDLTYDVGFIQWTLVVGVFTEIVIALRERLP
jgi:hypothetical protein